MTIALTVRPEFHEGSTQPELSGRWGNTSDVVDESSGGDTSEELSPVAQLVEAAAQGNSQAWQELVARFSGMIIAIGRRHRLCPADLGELQQTTWLRLVENIDRVEHPERVGGWLATTARRESLQLIRKSAKYSGGADQLLANLPDRHLPDIDAGPLTLERDAVLARTWAQLKPRCRELLAMMIGDAPLAYTDLSKVLNMPIGSIGPTRGRCLDHLRALLEREGITAR